MLRHSISASVIFLSAAFAHAADYRVPVPPPTPIPPPVAAPAQPFNWERCYIGAQIGHKDIRNDLTLQSTEFANLMRVNKHSTNIQGPHLGAQAGCNKLMDGLLIGLEIEGVFGSKTSTFCGANVDPVSFCMRYEKDWEFFGSARVGKLFDGFSFCNCGPTLLVYSKFGLGYTSTSLTGSMSQLSYNSHPLNPGGTEYTPIWANNFDVSGKRSFLSPLLGFGVEYAIDSDWTVRGEFAGMYSAAKGGNLTVTRAESYGVVPPNDATQVRRHVVVGDAIAAKMREIETKVSLGVNRLF